MTSSLHQWESDPLFSAAEVVQDSADRMESIYRLLLHEQSLVQGDHQDQRFLSSIDYHMRDLATILETTKWQLEDFERAVSSSAMIDKSRMMEDVISRHKQFIGAIREQINQVEKSLVDPSMGKFLRNSEWVNLNKQDRDGLALFLSGGNPIDPFGHSDHEDSSILKRFLDPNTASSSKDAGINEHESKETEKLKMNGIHAGPYYGSVKENNLRNVGSHYSARSGLDALDSLQATSCSRHNEDENWDLEANEVEPKSFFLENKMRGRSSRIFGYLNYLWTAYESRLSRNYTKRLKDGEEERNSPSCIDVPYAGQGWRRGISLASRDSCFQLCSGFLANPMHLCARLGACEAIYERFPNQVHPNRSSIQWILAVLVILTILGILVSRVV
ncbi:uncharacterized protein LOC116132737 isoform X1 [Pistacia vera]|uniref:uncharacterized protein LOC116132737 isoform X1 n=1 Tax=Pistacia vera TaxID=55513 RepID=UPI0012631A35|nr:uncharacterized protein LOC116132737 isoform X1 [Pistacia vera]